MAGHSKWANIKFRKAAQDAKRGRAFSKLIKEITVAARLGGVDADANPRLRSAVDKALAANMTRDTISRAVSRGGGDTGAAAMEEIRYEGYGPNGAAILVECATDNRNRAVGEVRHAFAKHGGNLGTDGSVAYLFDRIGCLVFADNAGEDAGDAKDVNNAKNVNDANEERIMEIALNAGALDVDAEDGVVEVVTAPREFLQAERAFKDAGLIPDFAELIYRAKTQLELSADAAEQIAKLTDALEQLDDVQNVFTNAILPGATDN